MTKNRKNLLGLVVLLQVAFFATWFYLEESKLTDPKATTILVKTIPVDPRDLISGNYFVLNYEFSRSWGFKKRGGKLYRNSGRDVFAVLKKDKERFVPDYFVFKKPKIAKDKVVIKGKVKDGRFIFGIEKYFINENQKEPNARKDVVEVRLVIDEDLQPRIMDLIVNGEKISRESPLSRKEISVEVCSEETYYFPNNTDEFVEMLKGQFPLRCRDGGGELCSCSADKNNRDFFSLEKSFSKTHPKRYARLLADLASTTRLDVYIPSMIQHSWKDLCIENPGYFVGGLKSLKTKELKDQSLRFLNEYGFFPSNDGMLQCIKSLEKKGFDQISKAAKQYLIDDVEGISKKIHECESHPSEGCWDHPMFVR